MNLPDEPPVGHTGGPGMSDLPSWVPEPGCVAKLTVANGGLVREPWSIALPYYGSFYTRNVRGAYSSYVLNPHRGTYGTYTLHGGGHANTNENTVFGMVPTPFGVDFVILIPGTPIFGGTEAFQSQNAVGNPAAAPDGYDDVWCEYPRDGKPTSRHSYGSMDIVGPENGGAAYGTYEYWINAGNSIGSNPVAASTPHAIDFAAPTGPYSWRRITAAPLAISQGTIAPWQASCFVPWQDRIYIEAGAGTASIKPRWIDRATKTLVQGIGNARATSVDSDSCAFFRVPERGLVVFCDRGPGGVRIQYGEIADQLSWSTAPLSQVLKVPPGWGIAGWCHTIDRIVLGGVAGDMQATYEVEIPEMLTDTWQIKRVPFEDGGIDDPAWTGAVRSNTYGKGWVYNEALQSFLWMPYWGAGGSAYWAWIYRPRIIEGSDDMNLTNILRTQLQRTRNGMLEIVAACDTMIAAIPQVPDDPPVDHGTVSIAGQAVEGQTLRADLSAATLADPLAFEWVSDGAPVLVGADPVLVLSADWIGRLVTLRVRSGSITLTSAAVGPVADLNAPPRGADGVASGIEDEPVTLRAQAFRFVDDDGHALGAVHIVTLPVQGRLELAGSPVSVGAIVPAGDLDAGSLLYLPPPNANGAVATLVFRVQDTGGTAHGGIDTSPEYVLRIVLDPANDAPSMDQRPLTVELRVDAQPGALIVGPQLATDPDGDALNFELTGASAGLVALDTTTGELRLAAGAALVAGDAHELRLRVVDPSGASVERVITVRVGPVDPPAGSFEPKITGVPQPPQYLLDDRGAGPTYRKWYSALGLGWRDEEGPGDWVDRVGTYRGEDAYASADVDAGPSVLKLDATALVRDLIAHGNMGIRCRVTGTGAVVKYAGRSALTPPSLVVTTVNGPVSCPCTSSAAWANAGATMLPFDSSHEVQIDSGGKHAALQFDLGSLDAADVLSAELTLQVTGRWGSRVRMHLHRLLLSRFQVGAGDMPPELGLAAEIGEANLRGHPDVIMAGDFTGTTLDLAAGTGVVPHTWGPVGFHPDTRPEVLPDPDAPGTTMFRGRFIESVTPSDPRRGSFSASRWLTFPDFDDPQRPGKDVCEEAHFRIYVLFEDDIAGAVDGFKAGLSWDLRMGYWVDRPDWGPRGGYWQSLTGNGGSKGDGRKHMLLRAGHQPVCAYNGHMLRMVIPLAPPKGTAYEHLRPLMGYNYNMDQSGAFPGDNDHDGPMYGNIVPAMLANGRAHCIEQRLKMNSIDLSVVDSMGNGTARPDGEMTTWLNGVQTDHRANYRWRRHPEMGISGVGLDFYMGGRQTTLETMHYRVNHTVVAKRYIGPRMSSGG